MFESNDQIRTVLSYIATRRKSHRVTTVDNIIRTTRIKRPVAIVVLRTLGRRGFGQFRIGRHGYCTRLQWHSRPADVAAKLLKGLDLMERRAKIDQELAAIGVEVDKLVKA